MQDQRQFRLKKSCSTPKIHRYVVNGYGRDTYVSYNQGGFTGNSNFYCKPKKSTSKFYERQMNRSIRRNNSMRPKVPVRRPDGTGRDSYISGNKGGFTDYEDPQNSVKLLRKIQSNLNRSGQKQLRISSKGLLLRRTPFRRSMASSKSRISNLSNTQENSNIKLERDDKGMKRAKTIKEMIRMNKTAKGCGNGQEEILENTHFLKSDIMKKLKQKQMRRSFVKPKKFSKPLNRLSFVAKSIVENDYFLTRETPKHLRRGGRFGRNKSAYLSLKDAN